LTLGSLIQILEGYPSGHQVRYEDGRVPSQFDSWRGVYAELTLMSGAADSMTVGNLLTEARAADGSTFQGYKGGDFTMGLHTPVWADEYGDCFYNGILGSRVDGDTVTLITADLSDYR
jgi:hypothetical protein